MDVSYSEQVTKPINRHVEETPGGRNDDDDKTNYAKFWDFAVI